MHYFAVMNNHANEYLCFFRCYFEREQKGIPRLNCPIFVKTCRDAPGGDQTDGSSD